MLRCPDTSTLQDFVIGALSNTEFERLAAHVHECPACESRLAQLDEHDDALLENLRAMPTTTSPRPNRDESDYYLQLTDQIVSALDSSGGVEVPIDAGRRLSRLLREGECRIGRFELLEEIGVGSFGHVFRARDTDLDRIVAIKVQRAGGAAGSEQADRFLREARNASALKHPHIVTLFETGQTEDGVCFLVSEFVEGATLAERMRQHPFAPQDVALLVADLTDALHFAHESGVVHRDIKPSNVIVDSKNEPHIADFGLAKRESLEETLTSDGQIMGTPAYMSPEQARGDTQAADRTTDIYSLGVILYEMLTLERPFQGAKRMLLLQVLEDDPRPPRHLDSGIPRDLETICLKAMAKSPSRRYRTAKDFGDDLRAFLNGDPIRARPVGRGERLWKWCRKYPLAAALFLGVTLGSVIGFAYLQYLNTWFVHEMALDTARQYSDALEEFNAAYSDVRGDFFGHGKDTGAVPPPLPATLQIEVAKRISRREDGMQVRIFSPHSFRKELRPSDAFEQETIGAFRRRLKGELAPNDRLERYEFVDIDGRSQVKFARGQLMKASCIDCHNTRKDSPKKDWKKGDLAGVLMLTRPLDRDFARTHAGFRGASVLMFAVAAMLTILGLVFARRTKAQRTRAAPTLPD